MENESPVRVTPKAILKRVLSPSQLRNRIADAGSQAVRGLSASETKEPARLGAGCQVAISNTVTMHTEGWEREKSLICEAEKMKSTRFGEHVLGGTRICEGV